MTRGITIGIIIVALTLLAGTFVAYITAKNDVPYRTLTTGFKKDEIKPEKYGQKFPVEYKYYLKNKEMALAPSKYGGSVKRDHLKEFPYMKTLWAGFAFSKDYTEDRGHVYALEDVKETKRISEKTALACMTCKSSQVPVYMDKWGVDNFYKARFREKQNLFTIPIGCYDCHDAQTMKLRITRPALKDALKRIGRDPEKFTEKELKNYICAQCHVTYYIDKATNRVIFPWDGGVDPEDMYRHYEKRNFYEWVHPLSGTKMLKSRHPEFEMFSGSVHSAVGLTCVDCHMPYVYEGGKKYSSHWWTSPLRTLEQSCRKCHREEEAKLRERVFYIQDRTYDLLNRAGKANEEAIKAINEAVYSPGADKALIEKARKLHREAQWYWDYVSSENSMGFHNPEKALTTLGKSIDLALRAKATALQAKK
ncbi:ammonia-forming cytochrome c nitrite reductase subunit c552 [Carboxydothermus hydrogenoformans]|uniref:nitrite reductase (cytochrome; ammonia-forming) n=1 Tax=Carboxydothermus hydrogenoformans (strain ATCC BAA-161 / DSM 6008 / Z-2901) TaxID=246194 RepID=Q3AFG9_CARHZ|nr:ammonia-forming cytochrome c nitrite reductase subunit c552 [Carboxydothermus hydrogenoformans]ABB13900.1 cytochrome c552 [Carboxydothermus hydrogenoformans Z-2901]